MKTGVLIHGCNLHVENWRHIAWGDPPWQLGRIPQGILVALEFSADLVVLGTGASRKPFRIDGRDSQPAELLESEYTLEYLRRYQHQLENFAPIAQFVQTLPGGLQDNWRQTVLDRLRLDTVSKNTVEEITQASLMYLEAGIERVILVSSPTHVVRCLRDAAEIYARDPQFARLRHRVFASPSVTCYEGTNPGDVVVVEPPHRPDRQVIPTHRRIQRMLDLQRLPSQDQVELIQEFDDLLQRYEHKAFTKTDYEQFRE